MMTFWGPITITISENPFNSMAHLIPAIHYNIIYSADSG